MKLFTSSLLSRFFSRVTPLLVAAFIIPLVITTGCGSGGGSSSSGGQHFSGNTNVTLVVSSTANDQVTRFNLALQTLTLTSESGNTATLLLSQQPAEFMHLNGGIEPVMTVSIPQGIYTSATATLGGAVFVCLGQVSGGGLGIANYSIVNQGPTVNLPTPITVTGSSMALLLNLQVSSSAVFPDCWTDPPFEGFSMSPTFNLTPLLLSSSPTNAGNGKVSGLTAEVALVGKGSSLTLTIPGGPFGTRTLSASSNTATVFQAFSGVPALSPGMFLNIDGAIQPDGSLLASRIALEDSSAINDSSGPVMFVSNVVPILQLYGRAELGVLESLDGQNGIYFDIPSFDFSNSAFNISGQLTNLQNLPFVPNFNASNMVAGQNIDITSGNFTFNGGGTGTPANTMTLVPQTVDGQIVASQPSGNFTDYTVSLASYDLFPALAAQSGQTSLLTNPSQVEVYVDNNTQMLNTQALAPGNTLRFYGLVFNDNGTLRMDCAQVNDGVSVTPQVSSSGQSRASQTQITRRAGTDGMLPVITTVTSH